MHKSAPGSPTPLDSATEPAKEHRPQHPRRPQARPAAGNPQPSASRLHQTSHRRRARPTPHPQRQETLEHVIAEPQQPRQETSKPADTSSPPPAAAPPQTSTSGPPRRAKSATPAPPPPHPPNKRPKNPCSRIKNQFGRAPNGDYPPDPGPRSAEKCLDGRHARVASCLGWPTHPPSFRSTGRACIQRPAASISQPRHRAAATPPC